MTVHQKTVQQNECKNVHPLPLQLLQFKEDNAGHLGSAAGSLEQALETTKSNINWVDLNKKQVFDWFISETSS